jgi:V-type H+-transporting ATPase subunit a
MEMQGQSFLHQDAKELGFTQMVGIIEKQEEQSLKRMIFRITKGNAWVQVSDIIDAAAPKPKAVYMIIYQG